MRVEFTHFSIKFFEEFNLRFVGIDSGNDGILLIKHFFL